MKFLRTPTETIAVIEGTLPDAHEWAEIERDGLLVNVLSMPEEAESLSALLPFAQHISRLAVNSSTCTDLSDVERIPDLRWLLVGGEVSRPPNPAMLPALEYFAGDPASLPGIVSLPTITKLKIKWNKKVSDTISVSTKELTLTEAGGLTGLVALTHLKNLTNLTIHAPRRLSLVGLKDFPSLSSLTLHNVKVVEHAAVLLQVAHLAHLTLEDCPTIDDLEEIVMFAGEARVVGRNPFTVELRAAAGSGWTFPPGRS